MTTTPTIPTLAWLEADQVPLVRAVAERVGLAIVAAGSPVRGEAGPVAAAFDARPLDDLRAALAACDAPCALIASPGEFGAVTDDSVADVEVLRACRTRGTRIISLEPMPASPLQLGGRGHVWTSATAAEPVNGSGGGVPGSNGGELVRIAPLTRLGPAMLDALEILPSFGPIRTVVFAAYSGRGEGSLGARLLDAMDLVASLLGEPERIDAAFMSPGSRPGGTPLHILPGETLRDLHGDLTANLRFADGRGAAITLSDSAGRWARAVTIIGAGGRIRITDAGFEWLGADGNRLDISRGLAQARAARAALDAGDLDSGDLGPSPAVEAIADAVGRYLHGREVSPRPVDFTQVLAMAGAALLSARTGEGESPATILRMAVVPV